MTTQTAFDKFQIKINKNLETGSIAVDKGRFVLIFNEAQNKLIEYILDKKNEDDIRYIQKILVSDYPVSSSQSKTYHQDFQLPENYFDFSNVYGLATKGKCKNKQIFLFEAKSDDKNELLQDQFNKPSFEARESLYNITSDTIRIYKEDFTLNKIFLSYYRYPAQIRLIDEENPESNFDTVNPEFDDKFVDRVISIAAGEFEKNSENPKYQVSNLGAIQKI